MLSDMSTKGAVPQDPIVKRWGEAVDQFVRGGLPMREALELAADRYAAERGPDWDPDDPDTGRLCIRPGLMQAYRGAYLAGLKEIDDFGRETLGDYLDDRAAAGVSGRRAMAQLSPVMGLTRAAVYDAFGGRYLGTPAGKSSRAPRPDEASA